jgi:hypothetical protein
MGDDLDGIAATEDNGGAPDSARANAEDDIGARIRRGSVFDIDVWIFSIPAPWFVSSGYLTSTNTHLASRIYWAERGKGKAAAQTERRLVNAALNSWTVSKWTQNSHNRIGIIRDYYCRYQCAADLNKIAGS